MHLIRKLLQPRPSTRTTLARENAIPLRKNRLLVEAALLVQAPPVVRAVVPPAMKLVFTIHRLYMFA